MSLILGKTKELWRKAYYGGSVDTLLDAVASHGVPDEVEIQKLDIYLSELQTERNSLKMGVAKYSKTDDISLPSPEKLMNMDEKKKLSVQEWCKNQEENYKKAREIFELAKLATNASQDQWMSWAMQLVVYQYGLDVYRVWKDQGYRARLVNIMDTYRCSRAVAEERAKLTEEYRAYKNAVLFRSLVEEAIKLCKKHCSNY